MRIGINTLPLSRVRAGAARMILKLIEELYATDSENYYYLYSDRDFEFPCEGTRWQKRVWSPVRFLPGTLWLQTAGRRMIIRDRLDAFWSTNNLLPLGLPSSLAKILTVHDLLWPIYSKIADPFHRCMYGLFFGRSIHEADRIVAVSQSTAGDLQRVYTVPEAKIEVIHHGVSAAFKPQDRQVATEYVVNKYGASKDYILTVGTIGPHKNLITLVKAMKILRQRGALSLQLLVVGARGRKSSEVLSALHSSNLTDNEVRFLGFVPEEDLPMLYSAASSFVFPSLYEGFGLPLVEAMACGAPIIASNTSSTPEIVGEAAVLVPPTLPEAFAEAILQVRSDEGLRRAIIEKGLNRASCFRWDRAARQLMNSIREAVVEKRARSVNIEVSPPNKK